jgi:hypothetical protein
MNYEEAIEESRRGKLIRRKAWEAEIFVFMRPADQLPLEVVVKAKSLPEDFKALFRPNGVVHLPFSEHLCRFTGDEVQNSVELPAEDVEATDWEITDGR